MCTVTPSSPPQDAASSSSVFRVAVRRRTSPPRWVSPARPPTSGGSAGWPRARPACRTDRAGRSAPRPASRLASSAASSGSAAAASSAPPASPGGCAWPLRPYTACSSGSASTAVAFWQRACAWFAERGVTVRAVLTDNGPAYRSSAFARACLAAGVRRRRTRPYHPQTNGKVERFHRTFLEEWAYVRVYRSEAARTAALALWLHRYNHHRRHTALGGHPPVSRVTNLPEDHS